MNQRKINNKIYEERGDYHIRAYALDEPFKKYIDSTLKFFADKKNYSILDVGAGEGLVTETLLSLGYDITALDVSDEAAKLFKYRIRGKSYENKARYIITEFENFNQKYDFILCGNTLHYVPNETTFVDKLKKLARYGTYITVPDVPRGDFDLRGYTKERIEELFPRCDADFEDELRWVIVWPGRRIQETAMFLERPTEIILPQFQNSLQRLIDGWEGEDKRYDFYKKDYYLIRQMNGTVKERIFDELKKIINDGTNQNKKLLDYGCGVGDTLIYAAERGWRVSGVEVKSLISDFCQWRMKRRNLGIDNLYLVDENNEYPKLPHKEFDLVVSNATIEHLKDAKKALSIIRESKKADGKEFFFIDKTYEVDHIANLEGVS